MYEEMKTEHDLMDAVFDTNEHNVADAIVALTNHYYRKGFLEGIKHCNNSNWVGGIFASIGAILLCYVSYLAGQMNMFGV